MGFSWYWFTKPGHERQENQDYAGIAQWENSLFAVIADGVSSCSDSGSLAIALVQCLVDRVIASAQPPTSTEIESFLNDAFKSLRLSCPRKASAAFLAAYFSADRLVYVIHAGDCRIGLQSNEGVIVWATEVHSLANASTPLSEDSLRVHPARNQLTRSFRMKRYKTPEITILDCQFDQGAILSTDGFWAGLSVEEQHAALNEGWTGPHDNEDDVSCLIVRWKHFSQACLKSNSNIYVKRKSLATLS